MRQLYLFLVYILLVGHNSPGYIVSGKNYESRSSLHDYSKKQTTSLSDEDGKVEEVDIGIILDTSTYMGVMANSCIAMGLSDFYSAHSRYTTRLVFHLYYSQNVLTTAYAENAALEMVNKAEVEAIIMGPQEINGANFVAEIGRKAQVPILSFSETSFSVSLSSHTTPNYFIRTAVADSSQLMAITTILNGFQWHEVVVIYQDTGHGFITSLINAFNEQNISLAYTSAISSHAQDSYIEKELNKMKNLQNPVFLVHMTSPSLGSQLFSLAHKVGMISKGNVWIITDGLSNLLTSMDAKTAELMEGFLGIRPYVHESTDVDFLKSRWGNEIMLMQKSGTKVGSSELNVFGLWAYDTVWALATAAEKVQVENPASFKTRDSCKDEYCRNMTNVKISKVGPRLLRKILGTRFRGLAGEFKLDKGQLETPVFEIINMLGNGVNGERTIGYWGPRSGLTRKLGNSDDNEQAYSTSVENLKTIIWPGDSTDKLIMWDAILGKKLRVVVPKKQGFREFVDAQNPVNVTGFCIDVFKAALKSLSFKNEPEFFPVDDENYTEVVNKLHEDYDAVVGDTTIRANRESIAEFSVPYTESGIVKVVKVEPDKFKNMWIFLKPLRWDLWLSILLSCILIGVIIRILERRVNSQRRLSMIMWFPLAILAFPERNMVGSKWARFVLGVWLFMAYILMQSYTANLSSILTVDQLTTSKDNIACAGYQDGSFVGDLLGSFNIKVSKKYSSLEEYDAALSKGCRNDGVDAIYDEIPYIKLFLHKYGSKYRIDGRINMTTAGFGFAFPIGSPLVSKMSKATLEIMESGQIQQLEKKYFGDQYLNNYRDQVVNNESRSNPSLTAYSFAGLFTITGFFILVALVCSECSPFLKRRRHNNLSRVHSIQLATTPPPENDLSIPKDSRAQPEGDDDDVIRDV